MELVDLYDENRYPLGKTAERREARQPGEYQTMVHICLFNSRGELLIQRRAAEKLLWPELWDVSAAGGVDAGETSRQAAEREFREELGLPLEIYDMRPTFTLHVPRGFDDIYIIKKDVDIREVNLQASEVSAVRWASCDELLALLREGKAVPYHPMFIRMIFALQNGEPIVKR